jgi:ribonuclease HI
MWNRCVVWSPNGVMQELSTRLEFECTNNQVEYEALVTALEFLISMGVRNIEAFGDSKLVDQQVRGESQCLDGTLNCYLDRCVQLVGQLDTFHIKHIHREHNGAANDLAQQASGYEVKQGGFGKRGRLVFHGVYDMHVDEGKLAEGGYTPGD